MPFEARTVRALRSIGFLVRTGMGRVRAQNAANLLIRNGARSLLIWGTAGGIDPAVEVGSCVLPKIIYDENGHRYCPANPIYELLRGLFEDSCRQDGLLTVNHPVTSVECKTQVKYKYKSIAVDMESAFVAEIAIQNKLPWAAFRAILDDSHMALPWCVSSASPGPLMEAEVFLKLLVSPGNFSDVIRLSRLRKIACKGLLDSSSKIEKYFKTY